MAGTSYGRFPRETLMTDGYLSTAPVKQFPPSGMASGHEATTAGTEQQVPAPVQARPVSSQPKEKRAICR
jgi:hypothetical protein